ncbi:MAG: Minichromosome maintenance protein MCM, partial [Candidatus Thorarchaeota archaeon AB_25]
MSGYDEQERFEEFLRTYKDEQGTLTYWSRIQQMSINDEISLTVNFQDLTSFDNVFMALAAEDPQKFLEMAGNALISVLRVEDPDYINSLDISFMKTRFVNYPDHIALRALRARHIGKLLHISGIMMRASVVKPLLVQAM